MLAYHIPPQMQEKGGGYSSGENLDLKIKYHKNYCILQTGTDISTGNLLHELLRVNNRWQITGAAFILSPHVLFLISNYTVRLLWKLLWLFFFFSPGGLKSGITLSLCGKALRFLFLRRAPLFVPHGTTVSEEILYNVSVAQGRPCPGSLLHALVSPCTHALLQMMSSVIQETLCQTDPSQAKRDFFLKMIKHPSELI